MFPVMTMEPNGVFSSKLLSFSKTQNPFSSVDFALFPKCSQVRLVNYELKTQTDPVPMSESGEGLVLRFFDSPGLRGYHL